MRRYLTIVILGLVIGLMLLAAVGQVQAEDSPKHLDLRIMAATDVTIVETMRKMPFTSDHTVEYDWDSGVIRYIFNTETAKNPNSALFYQVWWDAQFMALIHFEAMELRVTEIEVITDIDSSSEYGGSVYILCRTPAAGVRKFANADDGMTLWRLCTESFLWDSDAEIWIKLEGE